MGGRMPFSELDADEHRTFTRSGIRESSDISNSTDQVVREHLDVAESWLGTCANQHQEALHSTSSCGEVERSSADDDPGVGARRHDQAIEGMITLVGSADALAPVRLDERLLDRGVEQEFDREEGGST